MSYRPYAAPQPLLIGYDPFRDLPPDHLARLVERIVEETVTPPQRPRRPGQPPYDPRLCVKVLIYGYCTGLRSSRRLEQACDENLAFLYLTRGDTPSYRTLCTARTEQGDFLEAVWEGLFSVAAAVGLHRLGRIVVDSTKIRADVSPDAVLERKEFSAVRAELARILEEATALDAREEGEGAPTTQLGKTVPQEQMRDILRRVRKARREPADQPAAGSPPRKAGEGAEDAASPACALLPLEGVPAAATPPDEPPVGDAAAAPVQPMTAKMLARVKQALEAIDAATADGRKHLAVTDPEARMMHGGRERNTRECHSYEVAVDEGLVVAGGTTQENNDNARLVPLVTAAAKHEPTGVTAVTGDSGYYGGDAVAALLAQGLEVCVPDANTACDLHRGQPVGTTRSRSQGSVPFTYDAAENVYHCPEGNVLRPTQRRHEAGQCRTVYVAEASCQGCPQAAACLRDPAAAHRTLRVGDAQEELLAALARFAEPEFQEQYRHRGEAVETVFGFLRGTLGYVRWYLRGAPKVACEGKLFTLAYQFRKVHRAWAGA
jgi:transposase